LTGFERKKHPGEKTKISKRTDNFSLLSSYRESSEEKGCWNSKSPVLTTFA
jgi:hypothetical protein